MTKPPPTRGLCLLLWFSLASLLIAFYSLTSVVQPVAAQEGDDDQTRELENDAEHEDEEELFDEEDEDTPAAELRRLFEERDEITAELEGLRRESAEMEAALEGHSAIITIDGQSLPVSYEGAAWHTGGGPAGWGDRARARWVATTGRHVVTAVWTIHPDDVASCAFEISR